MKAITKVWLEAASLDIESITHIIHNDRLTGHVAFHAQQAIEKSLKAIIEEKGTRVPKIHSLSKLQDLCSSLINFPSNDDVVIALDSLFMESRYPGELGLLPGGKPTLQQAQTFYHYAQEVYLTVKNHLEA